MKAYSPSENLFIEEVTAAAQKLKETTRGLSVDSLITSIRSLLGMSRRVLAERAYLNPLFLESKKALIK